jgi:hypothetical protein
MADPCAVAIKPAPVGARTPQSRLGAAVPAGAGAPFTTR